MRIPEYLGLAHTSAGRLADAYRQVAVSHVGEPDIAAVCEVFARQCDDHRAAVGPMLGRYGAVDAAGTADEPPTVRPSVSTAAGSVRLLRDLQDLWLSASHLHLIWTVVEQAAHGLRDQPLVAVVRTCDRDTEVQLQWLTTRIKQAAPQALIVGR